ncbi:DUF4880 domain-containing protein [Pseudomonas sp. Gutcm_11s]|uniref:DUF4880 domain-containing protein n=1 Tax=Pseudomonas sp. Gutcm_11s TaxID=3026088 RepID=UPI00235F8797|nr:DUF4880 domain-containing protein [Pseudomonas sp. Gutcm_11s]MDD0844602.1 DUF4880 domain-containing protein [Pseudomonas sp. Gutcm_11s]
MSRQERLPTLPDSIVRTAIDWQMRLRAGAGNAELQRQWQEWLHHDARHQLAWQRLQQMGGLFQSGQLPAAQAIPLLHRAETDLGRRRSLKLLGLGLAVGGSGLLATQVPRTWHADFTTRTGERRQVALAGDAEALLNTGSALDVVDGELRLRAGEVLVQGSDWRVRCRFASCAGRDASVLLREHDGYSEIRVQRGAALVAIGKQQQRLQAGEGLAISAAGTRVLGQGPLDPFGWTRGLLVVNDIRLADFLAEAGRYRHGWLGCEQTVADLRLSGVFHLDEPTAMLNNISYLLPVRVVERTRWWVRVVAA